MLYVIIVNSVDLVFIKILLCLSLLCDVRVIILRFMNYQNDHRYLDYIKSVSYFYLIVRFAHAAIVIGLELFL